MAKHFLIKNNGYWYEAWYELSINGGRKLTKRPLKDRSGNTLKVIFKGHKDNEFEARLLFGNRGSVFAKIDIPLTIEEALPLFEEYLVEKNKKPLTIKTYLHDINILKDSLPAILKDHALVIINSAIGKLPVIGITKQKYAKSLARFYSVMIQKGVYAVSPIEGFEWVKYDPAPNPYKEQEIFKLLDVAKALQNEFKEPYYVFALFAFQVGLRLNDYINLKWDNLNWKDRIYNIFKDNGFNPKHGVKRKIQVPMASLGLLKLLSRKGEYIFCKPNGKKWDNHFPRDFVNTIFKVAEIKGDLDRIRETFASWSLACGRTPKSVKEQLGHKSYKELEAYDGIVNNPSQRIKELFGTIDVNTK
jgi:integrase